MLSLSDSTTRIKTLSLTTLATEQLSIYRRQHNHLFIIWNEARCVHQVTFKEKKRKGIEEKKKKRKKNYLFQFEIYDQSNSSEAIWSRVGSKICVQCSNEKRRRTKKKTHAKSTHNISTNLLRNKNRWKKARFRTHTKSVTITNCLYGTSVL